MKVELFAHVQAMLSLEREDLEVLKLLAEVHYDSVCRSLVSDTSKGDSVNGELTVWGFHFECEGAPREVAQVRASTRLLDTLLKVLELRDLSSPLTDAQKARADKLDTQFFKVLVRAGELGQQWVEHSEVD